MTALNLLEAWNAVGVPLVIQNTEVLQVLNLNLNLNTSMPAWFVHTDIITILEQV